MGVLMMKYNRLWFRNKELAKKLHLGEIWLILNKTVYQEEIFLQSPKKTKATISISKSPYLITSNKKAIMDMGH